MRCVCHLKCSLFWGSFQSTWTSHTSSSINMESVETVNWIDYFGNVLWPNLHSISLVLASAMTNYKLHQQTTSTAMTTAVTPHAQDVLLEHRDKRMKTSTGNRCLYGISFQDHNTLTKWNIFCYCSLFSLLIWSFLSGPQHPPKVNYSLWLSLVLSVTITENILLWEGVVVLKSQQMQSERASYKNWEYFTLGECCGTGRPIHMSRESKLQKLRIFQFRRVLWSWKANTYA